MNNYSVVSDGSESLSRRKDNDALSMASKSVASSHRRFKARKRINEELSEPLTNNAGEPLGEDSKDPYFVFRSDLENQLELVDEFLTEYLRTVHETNMGAYSLKYKDSKKQLKRQLKSVESTLRDVNATVQAVENDRVNFPHVDDSELFERKSFVETSRRRIQHARNEINSEKVKKKMDVKQRAIRQGDALSGTNDDSERQNTNLILNNHAQSSLLMHEQDETLDELGDAVTRVGEMAERISEDVGQQNKMLEDLERDITNAEEDLGLVMGKMAKFIGTKDRWQLRIIFTLSLIAVVMFFLVIYT